MTARTVPRESLVCLGLRKDTGVEFWSNRRVDPRWFVAVYVGANPGSPGHGARTVSTPQGPKGLFFADQVYAFPTRQQAETDLMLALLEQELQND